jgi:hypothetical protein
MQIISINCRCVLFVNKCLQLLFIMFNFVSYHSDRKRKQISEIIQVFAKGIRFTCSCVLQICCSSYQLNVCNRKYRCFLMQTMFLKHIQCLVLQNFDLIFTEVDLFVCDEEQRYGVLTALWTLIKYEL